MKRTRQIDSKICDVIADVSTKFEQVKESGGGGGEWITWRRS